MRIRRTNGTVTYGYVYNGSQLSQMTVGSNTLNFSYDANGIPMSVSYNGTTYYYATNLQGDVTAILNASGSPVVSYTYDAWGKPLTVTGSLATTLGTHNPLRYRGYVYDTETELYYVSSRYYNPEVGRWTNADSVLGQIGSIHGQNMFSYCFNNPVNMRDDTGAWPSWSQIFTGIAVVAVAVAAVATVVATAGTAAPALAAAGSGLIGGLSAGAAASSVATGAMVIAGTSATAAIITKVAENASRPDSISNQSVYIMRDKDTNDVRYIGRTNNPARRQYEHSRDPRKANLQPLEVKFSGLTVREARAVEQLLISAYTLKNLDNARREIAVGNVRGYAGRIGNILSLFEGAVESEFLNLMGR